MKSFRIEQLLPRADADALTTRAIRELGAVAGDAETATHALMTEAERIYALAKKLDEPLDDGTRRDTTRLLADCATRIFEACNFHDLAGQRIAQAVTAFTAALPADALLSGPKLDGEGDHVTQDVVDRLLAAG